jgi:hypothetical protein
MDGSPPATDEPPSVEDTLETAGPPHASFFDDGDGSARSLSLRVFERCIELNASTLASVSRSLLPRMIVTSCSVGCRLSGAVESNGGGAGATSRPERVFFSSVVLLQLAITCARRRQNRRPCVRWF